MISAGYRQDLIDALIDDTKKVTGDVPHTSFPDIFQLCVPEDPKEKQTPHKRLIDERVFSHAALLMPLDAPLNILMKIAPYVADNVLLQIYCTCQRRHTHR